MPQVKLIKPWKSYPAGRVLNLTGGEIDALQRTGKVAKQNKSRKKPEKKDGDEDQDAQRLEES